MSAGFTSDPLTDVDDNSPHDGFDRASGLSAAELFDHNSCWRSTCSAKLLMNQVNQVALRDGSAPAWGATSLQLGGLQTDVERDCVW